MDLKNEIYSEYVCMLHSLGFTCRSGSCYTCHVHIHQIKYASF